MAFYRHFLFVLWHFMMIWHDMTMLRAFQASREGRSWSHGQCQANPSHVQPHLWPPRPVFLCERSWKTWETHEKKWKKHEKSNKINKSTIEHGCQRPKSCRNVLKCVQMSVQPLLMLQQGIQRTSPVFRHSTLRFTLLHSNSEMPWQGETNLEFDLRYCASSTYIVFSAAVGQFYSTFEIWNIWMMLNWCSIGLNPWARPVFRSRRARSRWL